MSDTYRTSDGYVRAEHLRRGEVEQRGWRAADGSLHTLTLRLNRARPELWRVEHRIIGTELTQANSELFNTLTEARRFFRTVLKSPPSSYTT